MNHPMLPQFQPELAERHVPEQLWDKVCELITGCVFDAGNYVQLVQKPDDSLGLVAISPMREQAICFLIDHAWSFDTASTALTSLVEVPCEQLAQRIGEMLGADTERDDRDLFAAAAPLMQQYTVQGDHRVCFMMDEVGSRIKHCAENPNVQLAVFVDSQSGFAYTLCWPRTDIESGEELSADWHDQTLCVELREQLIAVPVHQEASSSAPVELWAGADGTRKRIGVMPLGTPPPGSECSLIVGAEQRVAGVLHQAAEQLQVCDSQTKLRCSVAAQADL